MWAQERMREERMGRGGDAQGPAGRRSKKIKTYRKKGKKPEANTDEVNIRYELVGQAQDKAKHSLMSNKSLS